jgi:hypothetical protein
MVLQQSAAEGSLAEYSLRTAAAAAAAAAAAVATAVRARRVALLGVKSYATSMSQKAVNIRATAAWCDAVLRSTHVHNRDPTYDLHIVASMCHTHLLNIAATLDGTRHMIKVIPRRARWHSSGAPSGQLLCSFKECRRCGIAAESAYSVRRTDSSLIRTALKLRLSQRGHCNVNSMLLLPSCSCCCCCLPVTQSVRQHTQTKH